jgi:glyoxylase-like metal-dependent hydrolase (beta-lactamase superfamily II)
MKFQKFNILFCSLFIGLLSHSFAQTIHEAAYSGDLDRIKLLLKEKPELLDLKNEDDETPLHYAAYSGQKRIVQYLIGKGANIESKEVMGHTPLHFAAYGGQTEAANVLISNKALLNTENIESNTPLHYAAQLGKIEMVRNLIDNGADINTLNFYDYTPLDLAELFKQDETAVFLKTNGGIRSSVKDPDVKHLSGNVYRLLFPFGNRSNIGISYGKEGFLLVDTGFSRRVLKEFRIVLDNIGNGTIKYIINTHLHYDHTAGNSIAGDKTISINYNNLDSMESDGILSKSDEPLMGKTGKKFDFYYSLKFNGEEIRLIPYPGIHTDKDLLVHFTGSKVVHMGDLLIPQSFPSITRKADVYLELLEKVIEIFPKNTKFISGHGRECTLKEVKKYHDMLEKSSGIVRNCMNQGMSKKEIRDANLLNDFMEWCVFIPILNTDYWINAVYNTYNEND